MPLKHLVKLVSTCTSAIPLLSLNSHNIAVTISKATCYEFTSNYASKTLFIFCLVLQEKNLRSGFTRLRFCM